MGGSIIAFEGIDGSGKSSQAKLLKDWLDSRVDAYLTEWNSSDWIHEVIKEAKKKNLLTPLTFSLIHATDFADRYERLILPMYRTGFVVVSDRYYYTAYARDSVRGVSLEWVKKLYSYAPKPDITFFIRVTPEVALSRLKESKRGIKPQEAGADVFPDLEPEEGFLKYQGMILEIYDKLAEEEGFVVLDGNRSPREIQMDIRRRVGELLWKERS
ncbi:thymidylate kinase / thymidylate synthase [Metallosphaera sedula]|uniref:Probable thymidylate kinase n=3 Tax=Metallosphaera TaxID=41980 RepID=A4YFE7_METS5|nr:MULTISPECIES: dTMP kinase [Metallosphaera]ABP95149.1 thymidylate kinase / thymidylate synthase [Metallosphaera sedula DSM 5348]AIM27135.1 thymidylate kinase / thymidylate synthase [Metallosphaera sedula]AKV74040.1 thymidylate kinase [Metallosphaera sedula]AKV76279.1 thymidylate kinase [Metallosphaera sedula]AKV78531.1 thymidylate kinase [Metallosphaera sedula]